MSFQDTTKTVYLRGDSATNGSVRISSDGDGNFLIEERVAGTWTKRNYSKQGSF